MCGICGAAGGLPRHALTAMSSAIAHRGPDDEGYYDDPEGRCSFGVRRLAIIDPEGGAQPVSNEDGTVWAAFNGEVYNFQALRTQLRSRGHTFRSSSDTEVLVHLYEEYGSDLVHAIDGMFALALWDERRGRLVLARDRFGEKPLFVRDTPTGPRFASELTGLTADPEAETPELDRDAVDAFFVLGYVPGPGTIVRGIRQLRPGHLLEWEASSGRATERSFWSTARFTAGESEDPLPELVAETVKLVRESVSRTLTADVPVGVFLSGGLDSTLLATLAQQERGEPVDTFSVGYDIGEVSELSEARRTAEQLGTRHHELLLSQDAVAANVESVFSQLDQPLADPALVPLFAIAEMARRDVKVCVGGEGADELFGGYPRYRWLARSAALRRVIPAPGRRVALRAMEVLPSDSRFRRFAELLDSELTLERHVDWVTTGRRSRRRDLYSAGLATRAERDEALRRLDGLVVSTNGSSIGAHGFMGLDQRSWLPDDVLTKADRAGMLNSLEVRTPYLSRELSEFANSVSASVHLGRWGKQLLRLALKSVDPRMDTDKPKTAFRVPGAEWLRGPLASLVERHIEEGPLVEQGFYDRDTLRAVFASHTSGAGDETAVLWPVLSLSAWYESFSARTD